MRSRPNMFMILLTTLSLCCIIGSVTIAILLTHTYASNQYHALSWVTEYIVSKYPSEEQELLRLIKDSTLPHKENNNFEDTILRGNGYTSNTFANRYTRTVILYVIIIIPIFLIFLFVLIMKIKNIYRKRIYELTNYLEQINQDKAMVLTSHREDDFSQLEDEMYKTITKLHQTREEAVKEHNNLADSLADISHQIKTPVTSISLMTQLLGNDQNKTYIERIHNHTAHLERLIEALLTLARIDAGAIKLERKKVNIYTMLQLSMEELAAVINDKNILVFLPNYPELYFEGDMEWSIEAFSNLIKNSVEHTPFGGSIKLDYFLNPLYLQIQLEDSGEGFSDKNLPHIFERFYRGDKAIEGGIGIGLSLAKELIEQQNGIISAGNLPDGGACFIVRFYSH